MLVAGGIDDSRISVDGWGEEKPIASNDTEEGRSRNRRTELVVQKIK
jgi:outer membrane protein OmpA-like peptidoglycan-associated protein